MTYQLSVQRVQDVCLFVLTWGQSQRLQAQIPYPPQLDSRYQQWQRAYLSFYQNALDPNALRGRAAAAGQVTAAQPDLHSHLVQAEARLLSEFDRWLRHGELAAIRQTLGRAARDETLDLFLTCAPIEIARLPWETWEMGAEFGDGQIRIARSPANIRMAAQVPTMKRHKPRVLVILGDATNASFAGDRQALQSLQSLVEIVSIGWQPGTDTTALKQEICEAIADPLGWDILFFAGHSNEADAVAGQIYVAPRTAIAIRELQSSLKVAQAKGLQFALFNSCSGLNIADALIELGLSQVAIMREPIHNQVAHRFLTRLLQSLAQHRDVQDALQATCRYLKVEQHLTHPSAYLVPSLFRHPNSTPFQIPPVGWRQTLAQWLPSKRQWLALGAIVGLSVLPSVQEALLSQRLLGQAIYRNLTGQMPTDAPEVLLVQVDEASRQASPELADISPINQSYLAQIIDSLTANQAQVIGIDYLLDLAPTPESPLLAESVRQAVDNHDAWIIFGAKLDRGREVGVNPASDIANLNWTMEAYTNMPRWYMGLPWDPEICQNTCPFNYLLALTAHHQASASPNPVPDPDRQTPLRNDLITTAIASTDPSLQAITRRRISLITALGGHLKQRWLRPILDFSLPPEQVFDRVSAYTLLDPSLDADTARQIAAAKVVLIGGVDYEEGGIDPGLTDMHPNPPAIAYWRQWGRDDSREKHFAGVEAIAYDVHHQLNGHLVTPVPALWMVGVAAFVGPAIALYGVPLLHTRRQGLLLLTGLTVGYGLVGLQAVIMTGVLLPWLLPTATIWIYGLPSIRSTLKP